MENGHLQFSPYPGESLQLGEEKGPFLLVCCSPAASVPSSAGSGAVDLGQVFSTELSSAQDLTSSKALCGPRACSLAAKHIQTFIAFVDKRK